MKLTRQARLALTPILYGREIAVYSSDALVTRRGSSQPFLLKLTIDRPGTFTVQGQIDG